MTQYNDVLKELQYYILNEENIKGYLEMKIKYVKKEKTLPIIDTPQKIQNKIFIPREQDTLFWCFYIIQNGDTKYETMYNKNDIIARQMKIEYIDIIRKNKQIIKKYKFDSISNIENNLANEKSLNINAFLTLCAILNINILFVNNKTYYESFMNDTESIFIIYCLNNKENNKENKNYSARYGFEIGSNCKVSNIKSTLYKVDNIAKPINSVSSYNISELIEICNKLAIEIKNVKTGKNKQKKELYESIIQYF
jgi:hypothetical protein